MDHDEHDVEILAKTAWGEARGESPEGQVAVMWVIRNRAQRRYGGIVGSTARAAQAPWQFSCWNTNDPNRAKLLALTAADPIYANLLRLAEQVLTADPSADPSKGADHYHTLSIHPGWADSMGKTVVIGHHVFYDSRTPPSG